MKPAQTLNLELQAITNIEVKKKRLTELSAKELMEQALLIAEEILRNVKAY